MIAQSDSGFLDDTALPLGTRRVAVKDSIDVEGSPTGAGSRAFEGAIHAQKDADIVARLRQAGWQIAGKTRLHELAYGVSGINPWQRSAPNPLFPGVIPGGSSSGSASVVAAGLVEAALGSDTGGSVRIPAACCGVIGLKPGYGAVSRIGMLPVESSLDCPGVFARDLATLAEVYSTIADTTPPRVSPAAPLRFIRIEVAADPCIITRITDQLAAAHQNAATAPLHLMGLAFDAGMTVMAYENARAFGHLVGQGCLGVDIEARLSAALRVTPDEVAQAETVRQRFRAEVDALLADGSLLVLPTLSRLPPTLVEQAQDPTAAQLTDMVRPFNLSGHPGLALPLAPIAGRPASLQLVAPMGGEMRLLQAAALLCPGLV